MSTPAAGTLREADLYAPVKAYLEAQGYEVKAEIGPCDVFAVRGDEPPVIVELKLTFSLELVQQGIARQTLFQHVYLAVPDRRGAAWKKRYRDTLRLCRRLGLGLLAVRLAPRPGNDQVKAHLDPGNGNPNRRSPQAARLLREFDRREGDPNVGGTSRTPRMTAYRQDALRCARLLHEQGPMRAMLVARAAGVEHATRLMRENHYGWFDRVSRGVYRVSDSGAAALATAAVPCIRALETNASSGD